MGSVFTNCKGFRRLLAAVFVLLMLAEFGSHALICRDESSFAGRLSVSAAEQEHEDPCRTMMQCGYDQNGRNAPKFTHDASPHNALLDRLFASTAEVQLNEQRPILHETVGPIFRPHDPPFRPPKRS